MISAVQLKTRSVKDLATMARKKKVLGWHTMRKEQLVRAILRKTKVLAGKRNGAAGGPARGGVNGHAAGGARRNGSVGRSGKTAVPHAPHNGAAKKARTPHLERRLQEIKTKLADAKDLSVRAIGQAAAAPRDRLVVMVRDPYWLHAYWELGQRGVQRAEAAMGQHWHAARPVLRVHELRRNGTTSAARQAVRDVEIHGGVNNWYIDVQNPPKSYQLEIGYLAPGNRFYCLARSNVVSTPPAGTSERFDRNWAEVAKDFDRVYAMTTASSEQEANGDLKDVLEEQLHRSLGNRFGLPFGPAPGGGPKRDFQFQVDTELIVHGVTRPDARVTLRGEPVRLRPDGTFAVRFSLPDRRHVLPVVASSGDGAEQRTIVLAVDRNTKVMEPVSRDSGE
ncbi:MAG: DUF4912 domain-containing protein [Thermoguttaceae bacterium]